MSHSPSSSPSGSPSRSPSPQTTPSPEPSREGIVSAWRRQSWLAGGVVVAGIVLFNAAAWLIDFSPLEQGPESWGYAFGAFFMTLWAVPGILLVMLAAVIGGTTHNPGIARVGAWLGAGVAALIGVALLVFIAFIVWSEPPAGVVFSVASVLVTVVLVLPLVRARRLAQSLRSRT